jgi:DNA-binding transcriptional MocR family regulator
LELSPATVAAAYRLLAHRGIVFTDGRRGTRVAARPPVARREKAPSLAGALTTAGRLPEGVVDLASGNPDPALLPDVRPHLERAAQKALYGAPDVDAELAAAARADFTADGIPAEHIAVVSGALDGCERVLEAHLKPGDRVAVEDPGYVRVLDLVAAMALIAIPVELDDAGMRPEGLAEALRRGARAVLLTPRAQNPTGAALDPSRAGELARTLRGRPEVLVIEDDHAGAVAGAPAVSLAGSLPNPWAAVRSVSKSLGPDLRIALLAGDAVTVARVRGRQALGPGWVSGVLQRAVASLTSDKTVQRLLNRAGRTYEERRGALRAALSSQGIGSRGASGLNVWIPAPEEARLVGALLARGWAVAAGERYRIRTGPALRVTAAALEPRDALRFAENLAACLRHEPAVAEA